MNVTLTLKGWSHVGSVYLQGYFFLENRLMEGKEAADFLDRLPVLDLIDCLRLINGIYSIIVNREDLQLVAIDGTRLFPIYYSVKNDELSVSDTPDVLLSDNWEFSSQALSEYHATAATFAGNTLAKGLFQMKGFHYAVWNGRDFEQFPYYSYLVRKSEIQTRTGEFLMEMLDRVFDRLIESVHDRQIVIPLSGGLDSRLIACMLKKKGYENVFCFTVSRPDTNELRQAQSVAEHLNYPFAQIDISGIDKGFVHDEKFRSYCEHLGGFTNFVWLFEYFALIRLRENGLITEDAVFVPGHTGDFLGGSQLTKVRVGENDSVAKMTRHLLYDHFEYDYHSELYDEVRSILQKMSGEDICPYSLAMNFIFQNRLPQQINNSARVYEYFGYDVRLPFWDREMIEFFRIAPYNQVYQKRFYNEYLNNELFAPLGVALDDTRYSSNLIIIKQHIKHRLKRFLPKTFLYCFANFNDDICEKELCEVLLDELLKNGYSRKQFLSNNEIIKEWYIMLLKEKGGNSCRE